MWLVDLLVFDLYLWIGVVGLIDVIVVGNVVVVNVSGVGVFELVVFVVFLLCFVVWMMGEDLCLFNIVIWWCG